MKNFNKILIISAALLFAFTACQNEQDNLNEVELLSKDQIAIAAENTEDCSHVHWSYTGPEAPEYWKDLCPGWADCGGISQSPINITSAYVDDELEELDFKYNITSTSIVNNGHTVQFNVDDGNSVVVKNDQSQDKVYKFLQFHYHGLSEHQVSGQHYPLEVHLVHKADDGMLAVVGIFFVEGKENALFAEYLEHFPHEEGTYNSSKMIELKYLLPESPYYYTYSGSLTTPPCSEIVTWFVMQEPIEASASQIHEFSEILHNNFRPVQPLNGRYVFAYMDDDDD